MAKKLAKPNRKRFEETLPTLLARKPRKREDYWDKALRGLGLRLTPAGSATFVVGGRIRNQDVPSP